MFSTLKKKRSPLRYPGGKAKLFPIILDFIRKNELQDCSYVEPFAGGCGLALGLLMENAVSTIHINDIDKGIWAFWHCILNSNSAFIDKMRQTQITIEEWYKQKRIILNPNSYSVFELGFATFFLNRANRSGIISAGVIGGFKQNGQYKIDCRFNKDYLEKLIKHIGLYADRIELSNMDALDLIKDIDNSNQKSFLYIDPPYHKQGKSLYTNFYKTEDHQRLAKQISILKSPWIVTYDDELVIRDLYRRFRTVEFNLKYSLQTKRSGSELMIVSEGTILPKMSVIN
ncbi:MAG: DNA methyltransferase [Candidatus Liberibacter europaeus]|uniref:site-specific DNA-methyltransferase (adenine-specific) n=1 Tax=Candidatus Liberibacter europaeus TaxID=744859 RepID=A0A2T4VWI5_9HYPH|nr:DNA methyltransferase [Candidatus Liberibacter europaeus]PTL86133.1 MAG: DNA methyltransferase [Candidatus Liberibacter europaeus]